MAAPSPPAILYLHGLASSPKGRKRDLLEKRFEKEGVTIVAPDLNVPSFRKLDFLEMKRVARAAFDRAEPRVIVGSSLGALVALSLSEALSSSGEGRLLPIHRRFFEAMADVRVDAVPPAVAVSIVMGTDDESVPFAQVADAWARWEASGRLVPGSRFHRVEGGDHGLVERGAEIESAVRERMAG